MGETGELAEEAGEEAVCVLDDAVDEGTADEVLDAWKTIPFDDATVLGCGILALRVCMLEGSAAIGT